MFCIITNQTCDWRLSHLRRLILVTYASSQWRGKKFLIEHVVNVKTLNGSEHDGRSFKRYMDFMLSQLAENISFFFLLKLKILEAKVKFWCGIHMTQLFLKKFLIFYKILEESEQFFILFFKENRKSEAVFQHFWSARRKCVFERGVTQIWSFFFIAKLIICLVWIKKIV